MTLRRSLASAFLTLTLISCVAPSTPPPTVPPRPPAPVPSPPPTVPPPAPLPHNAILAGISAGPSIASLPGTTLARAYAAFRISCPSVTSRSDSSGLTRPEDWQAACADAAAPRSGAELPAYFSRHFELVRVGDGQGFATGYFEPEIAGVRSRQPGFDVPVYRTPPDLVRGTFPDGSQGRGRYGPDGVFTQYPDRAAIEDGALAGKGLEIGWAADPVELFFLHIQGSGRLRAPDGTVVRIGYDNQNGRDYVGIGRLMRDRGLLQPGGTSMQHIVAWLRANPVEGKAIMRENLSYIFFKELTGPGPLGALGRPVTGYASVAADPNFVPLGAPVYLDLDRPEADGFWVAQDTGGAIKGANRFDTFWGAGAEAARIAGGMSGRGTAYLLLPKGTLARHGRNGQTP